MQLTAVHSRMRFTQPTPMARSQRVGHTSAVMLPPRFGNQTAREFRPSPALTKAYDRLLHPVTSYLPFWAAIPALVTPSFRPLAVTSRKHYRETLAQSMQRSVSNAFLTNFGLPSKKQTALPTDPVIVSDGKQFAPWFQAQVLCELFESPKLQKILPELKEGHPDIAFFHTPKAVPPISHPYQPQIDALMTRLCKEYTQWLSLNGPVKNQEFQRYTLTVQDGKIIVTDFKEPLPLP